MQFFLPPGAKPPRKMKVSVDGGELAPFLSALISPIQNTGINKFTIFVLLSVATLMKMESNPVVGWGAVSSFKLRT